MVNRSTTPIFTIHSLLNTSFDSPLPSRSNAAMVQSYTRAIVWLGLTSLALSVAVDSTAQKMDDSPNGYIADC